MLVRPPRPPVVVHLDGYVSLRAHPHRLAPTPRQAHTCPDSGFRWQQVTSPAQRVARQGPVRAGFTSHFSRVVRAPSTAQWLLPDDLRALLLPLALAGLGGVSVSSCFPSGF